MTYYFKFLLSNAKLMKLKDVDYIMINEDVYKLIIIGCSSDYNFIKTICYDYTDIVQFNQFIHSHNNYIYKISSLKKMIAVLEDSEVNDEVINDRFLIDNVGYINNVEFECKKYINIFESDSIRKSIVNKYNYISNYISNRTSYMIYNNIEEDDNFKSILLLKSSDGAKPYILQNGMILYLFNNLLPINKSDTVSIEISDNPNDNIFLSNFIITKKKTSVNNFIFYYKM